MATDACKCVCLDWHPNRWLRSFRYDSVEWLRQFSLHLKLVALCSIRSLLCSFSFCSIALFPWRCASLWSLVLCTMLMRHCVWYACSADCGYCRVRLVLLEMPCHCLLYFGCYCHIGVIFASSFMMTEWMRCKELSPFSSTVSSLEVPFPLAVRLMHQYRFLIDSCLRMYSLEFA